MAKPINRKLKNRKLKNRELKNCEPNNHELKKTKEFEKE